MASRMAMPPKETLLHKVIVAPGEVVILAGDNLPMSKMKEKEVVEMIFHSLKEVNVQKVASNVEKMVTLLENVLILMLVEVIEVAVVDVVEVEAIVEVVVVEALVMDLELSNASIAKVKVTCLENAQSPKKSVNQEVMAMDLVSSSASTAKVRVTCLENVLNQRRSVSQEAMEMDQE